jgi:hypothetical protein
MARATRLGLPHYIAAREIREVLGPKYTVQQIEAAVTAYGARLKAEGQVDVGWQRSDSGIARTRALPVGHALGIPHGRWVDRLDTWLAIARVEGTC